MGFTLKTLPSGGGGWIKPAEHEDDYAILIEVKSFDRQVPTQNGPKDRATCDLTYFATKEALAAGQPYEVKQGVYVEQTALARDLGGLVGSATAARLKLLPGKQGRRDFYVWDALPVADQQAVVAYAEKRDAEVSAAVAAAPSFDDAPPF